MFTFIQSLFTVIFIAALPVCFTADDQNYTECYRAFECGTFTNMYYPFWGNGRAEHCGHPDFKLECKDDETVEMQNGFQKYHVLSFAKENNTLHITTSESWNDDCPSPRQNLPLSSQLFNYSLPSNTNITLAYGCPQNTQLRGAHRYSCSVDENSEENYYWVDSDITRQNFSNCTATVTIPILKTVIGSLNMMAPRITDIWKIGFLVQYDANNTFCSSCERSQGQCGYDITSRAPTCFCYDRQNQGSCPTLRPPEKGPNIFKKVIIGSIAGAGTVVLTVLFFLCWRMGTPFDNSFTFWKRKKKSQKVVEDFLKNHGSLVPKRYHYTEIKYITNSFNNKIGQGGYGGVYKGKLFDGRPVAVKLLHEAKGDGQEFINEVASISRTNHVNVVNLLGFCFEGSKRALIYEFMANGSLEKFIYNHDLPGAQSQLGWETLYQIAVGVGRGLEYLHRGCNTRILHFDIKPHNILLDEDFTPKISDFGLSKLCPRKESIISMLDTRGTVGYIAPELVSRIFGGVSHKSDVYSYGMMVLEMVGRRKNVDIGVDHTSEIYFPNWIYDHLELNQNLGLHGNMSDAEAEIARRMILVALWCIQTNPTDRPAMSRVLEMLEVKQEQLSIPPKPRVCSPQRSPSVSSTN